MDVVSAFGHQVASHVGYTPHLEMLPGFYERQAVREAASQRGVMGMQCRGLEF